MGSNLGSKSPTKNRCQYPIFLDTKPQLVNIGKKGHLFQFDDHYEFVLINGHKFQTNFGQWHSPIMFYVGGIEYRLIILSPFCSTFYQLIWQITPCPCVTLLLVKVNNILKGKKSKTVFHLNSNLVLTSKLSFCGLEYLNFNYGKKLC